MTGDPWIIVPVTAALVALSAFFVAIEFALIAAKRHRLQDAAATSRAARAALRSSSELTLLLAGSQLGITACTLALGAISKPAVHHWLTPAFESCGIPPVGADVAGFVLALVVVTFIHLVVGEMAPKSWAIAHPEKSATLLAIPMRAFMAVFRPLLRVLNEAANSLLRRCGIEPVNEVAVGHSPDALRHLVEHSVTVGALDAGFSAQISAALELQELTVRDLVPEGASPTGVDAHANVGEVRRASLRSGHLRILIDAPGGGRFARVVHVRDTLLAADDVPAADFARPVFSLDGSLSLHAALKSMRETRNHLAVVEGAGGLIGVVTLADVLSTLLRAGAGAESPTAALGAPAGA